MVLEKLVKVYLIGFIDAYPIVEDAFASLKCIDVTRVEREGHHFVVDGWLPQIWFEDLSYILENGTHGLVALFWNEEAGTTLASIPTELENPRFVRPYQYLVEMFSLPGREGYDPSAITFITLPLFFGFVVGDIGYGITFILLGLYIRQRFYTPLAQLVASFMIFGGVWSIIFGSFLFSEIFAFPLKLLPLPYPPLNKLENVNELLAISLIIGLIHLDLGIWLGFQYERRRVGLRTALFRKVSWYILEAGLALLVIGAFGYVIGPLWIPGLAIIAFAIALLSMGGSIIDVVEVPSFVGNILSYVRLGFLAVAKGVMGVIVNTIVLTTLAPLGIIGWSLGAIVLIMGHGMVMGLALLTVTIHALRLHYVEFYSKFYEPEEIGEYRAFEPTTQLPKPEEPQK